MLQQCRSDSVYLYFCICIVVSSSFSPRFLCCSQAMRVWQRVFLLFICSLDFCVAAKQQCGSDSSSTSGPGKPLSLILIIAAGHIFPLFILYLSCFLLIFSHHHHHHHCQTAFERWCCSRSSSEGLTAQYPASGH